MWSGRGCHEDEIVTREEKLRACAAETRTDRQTDYPFSSSLHNPFAEEPFEWGSPDLPQLVQFCFEKFGWSENYTNQIMDPVIEKVESTVCIWMPGLLETVENLRL